jgi:hypothetical protein
LLISEETCNYCLVHFLILLPLLSRYMKRTPGLHVYSRNAQLLCISVEISATYPHGVACFSEKCATLHGLHRFVEKHATKHGVSPKSCAFCTFLQEILSTSNI